MSCAEAIAFLERLQDEGHIDALVVDVASKVLKTVFHEFPKAPVPRIGPGPDGMVGMTWQNTDYHVSIEISSDGRVEFFSEDLKSGALWGQGDVSPALGSSVFMRLHRIIGEL